MSDNRRDFLKKGALLGLAGLAAKMTGNSLESLQQLSHATGAGAFELPALPYAYDALEPFIDRQTMEIHHTRHHKAYIDKLNGADLSALNMAASNAEKCKSITSDSPAILRNNLGGHYNHCFFWEILQPNPGNLPNLPSGKLADAINSSFKSFEEFKKEFSDKALKLFGSGWCWLVKDEAGKLQITTTPNQDNPLMKTAAVNGSPILALDVWEHAYYLKYQNKRVDYIGNWWNIVNWKKAETLFGQ